MRAEFQTGLDALSKFIFERAKPKQMGSTVMTGPLLAGLTQSFLDALNAGAVPTICTSWQVALPSDDELRIYFYRRVTEQILLKAIYVPKTFILAF